MQHSIVLIVVFCVLSRSFAGEVQRTEAPKNASKNSNLPKAVQMDKDEQVIQKVNQKQDDAGESKAASVQIPKDDKTDAPTTKLPSQPAPKIVTPATTTTLKAVESGPEKVQVHPKNVKQKIEQAKQKEKAGPKGEEKEDYEEKSKENEAKPKGGVVVPVAKKPEANPGDQETPQKLDKQAEIQPSTKEEKENENKAGEKHEEEKAKAEIAKENEKEARQRQALLDTQAQSGHVFTYLLIFGALLSILYLVIHNKNKLLGMIIEGRSGRRPSVSRRAGNVRYRRLSTTDPGNTADDESGRSYVS
ncbi:trans-Golgi network integral membrane protein 2 [Ditylenchus destructor]|uniref:Trans-Golgi network integral membrane protein 2 n=1 Tax=Ditylenchus destructor TaxID=166010 RepID=A0AAD4MWK9_9BILA|nr:trans-Golgi network integral membrane protein 2 [Ditylenchus destructor]